MTDTEALLLATKAMQRIEDHEKLCAFRWTQLMSLIRWSASIVVPSLVSILGLMIHDKFF